MIFIYYLIFRGAYIRKEICVSEKGDLLFGEAYILWGLYSVFYGVDNSFMLMNSEIKASLITHITLLQE